MKLGRAFAAVVVLSTSQASADDLHRLSLADAVKAAISNDAQLSIARVDSSIASTRVDLARSEFSTKLFGDAGVAREELPPTATSFSALDNRVGGRVGLDGKLDTGLAYTITAGLSWERYDSAFASIYIPATTTSVTARIVQPLLRGAFSAARQAIVVAAARHDQSEHDLRARLEHKLGMVESAYWNLVRAHAEHEARTQALQIATQQVEEVKRLKKFGTGSDLDIVEAEAGVSRRKYEQILSEQDVATADAQLYDALGVQGGKDGWTAKQAIEPTDQPQIEPKPIDLEAQLAKARTNRADMLATREQVVAELSQLELDNDHRRAAIDLVASAGVIGFAGTLASSVQTDLDPTYANPKYNGGFKESLSNTFGRDFQVFVGLRFELPLGNHPAEAQYQVQKHLVERTRLAERELQAHVESEVRATVARLTVHQNLIEETGKAVIVAQSFVEGMQKRFRSGAATTFDVLRASEELTRAKIESTRARTDYRIALTQLATVTGTLLEGLDVTVASLPSSPH